MKKVFALAICLMLLAAMAAPAFAAEVTENLQYLDRVQDIVFRVKWDKEQPSVVFLAPNGTVYDPMKEMAGTTTVIGQNELFYVVEKAARGQWKVRYDKLSNEVLEISVKETTTPVVIESFQVEAVDGNRLPYRFTVSGAEDQRYQYEISAITQKGGVKKLLASGNAYVDEEITGRVDLSGLSSHSAYMLQLDVWYMKDGVEINDFAYSDPFAYKNENADQNAMDFHVTVQPEENLLEVSWPNVSWNTDKVLVAIFEDGAAEPMSFDEYDPHRSNSVQLSFSPTAKQVAVEVTATVNGVNAAPVRKTMDLANYGISLPAGNAFNSVLLPMTYANCTEQLATVTVNGYATELVLNGSGTTNITLGDDWNQLEIRMDTQDNVTWCIRREIFIDRVAPKLTMSQPYDGMSTKDPSVVISGTALDCAWVTVNGQNVALDGGNQFSFQLSLAAGGNTVHVVASDKLGNETQYTALIYCGEDMDAWLNEQDNQSQPGGFVELLTGEGTYWVLGIAGVSGLLVIGYALLFWRKEG